MLVPVELEPDSHQTKPKKFQSETKISRDRKLKVFSSAGEDLVPEPPLQAQATGEGEGHDGDAWRVWILAAKVRSILFEVK